MPNHRGFSAYVRGAVILQAGLLGGCGSSEDATRAAPVAIVQPRSSTAPIRVAGPARLILAFGDSLYAGYGLKAGESLPADIETALRQQGIDARVINAGVSGDTSAAGRKRLAFALDKLPRRPDLVLLGLGGNDVLRQIAVDETRANLDAMLDELKRRKIPVVMTGMLAPPNLGPDYAVRFNAMFPELARAYGATLDPFILAGVLGNRTLMLPDGVHPNAKGVDVMTMRIAPIVADRLQRL